MSWEVWAMTLRTSLFNQGIFENALKRFKWGSFLYFVILFLSVPFALLVEDASQLVERYALSMNVSPILMRGDYIGFPVIFAILVPTVVAALVFNNMHSAKQSVFVHSLPVDRKANYISNLLASFVLMAAPVVLNGAILMIMSFTAYSQVISSWSVVYWMFVNLSVLFIMFSVAVFTAFLTGNTAAHIGVNVFIHTIPMIAALIIFLISEEFLYGFIQSDSFIADELMTNTPVVWLFGKTVNGYRSGFNIFTEPQMWIFLIGAVLVYALAFLLYRNRKVEACGDVAAFKVFGPILKYTVVTAVAAAVLGILASTEMSAFFIFTVALVLCAIVYFAAEMLMNKSFKVFKTSYKGFCGFTVCCAAFIAFFAFTSVFGYETRIPKSENIEKASAYVTWSEEKPVVDDRTLIEDVRAIHKDIISDIPVVDDNAHGYLKISYQLTNGKTLDRAYRVSQQVYDNALSKMYENTEYKLKVTGLENLNIENVDNLTLGAYMGRFNYYISLNEDAKELLKAVKKDIEEGSYKEIEDYDRTLRIRLEVSCTVLENVTKQIFKNPGYSADSEEAQYAIKSFDIAINPSFKNAYAFLEEKGYYDQIINQASQSLCIAKKPVYREGETYTYKGDVGRFEEFRVGASDFASLSVEDAAKLANWLAGRSTGNIPEGKSYFVFCRTRNVGDEIWFGEKNYAISEAEMPEYMKKYIEE